MGIRVCENLKLLANEFNKCGEPLYIVGGYVRNSLLGVGHTDMDIASSMDVANVEKICTHLGFRSQVVNKKLGTLLITTNKEQFEYTRFRAESYGNDGQHVPTSVQFVNDIKIDASRRDFTINSLFYDITNRKIIDLLGGVSDLEKKTLRTCKAPDVTFADDGVRILRLVRFACEFGFRPERKTLETAQKVGYNINAISRERVLKELKLSANGALKYQQKSTNHKHIVEYYNKLNLWQYIFNSSFRDFKVTQSGRMYNAFVKSSGDNRYIAFMCMVINNYLKRRKTTDANLIILVHTLLGAQGLKDSSKNMQEVLDAYRFAQRLLYDKPESYYDNRSSLQFENLGYEIKNYLALVNPTRVDDIKLNVADMKKRKIPFDVSEINITNAELIDGLHIKNEYVSLIRQRLFEMCVDGIIINDNQVLVENAKYLNQNL